MPQHPDSIRRYIYSLLILLITLSPLSRLQAATTVLAQGAYCPAADILLITAEDLSSSLELIMRSRAAQARGDLAEMVNTLNATGSILQQTTSRGAGARTALLIDSIILARPNESNQQLLTWFPLLHSALLALPDDYAQDTAEEAVGHAEEILQGDRKGDALEELKKARHFLTCDGLNLPLQAAIVEQSRLFFNIQQHRKPLSTNDYDKILASLHNAMNFILEHSKNAIQ